MKNRTEKQNRILTIFKNCSLRIMILVSYETRNQYTSILFHSYVIEGANRNYIPDNTIPLLQTRDLEQISNTIQKEYQTHICLL